MKDYTVFQNVIIVMCECIETRVLAIAAINWNCIKSTLKCKTEQFDRIASTQNVLCKYIFVYIVFLAWGQGNLQKNYYF